MDNPLLIKKATLATFFNDGYNAIKIMESDILIQNGVIEKIGRDIEADCLSIDGTGKLACPGLVNGRSRSLASRLSKGIAEDLKFDRYDNTPLYTRVNPLINIALTVLDSDELKSILELALYEAIDSGTTTLFEHCTSRDLPLFLELCEQYGLRTVAAPMLMSRRTLPEADAWGNFDDLIEAVDEAALIAWNRGLVETYRDNERVQAAMGLASADLLTENLMLETAKAAEETNGIIMVPLNETRRERKNCQDRFGLTPVEVLRKAHVLHEKTLVGGNAYTTPEDRRILKSMSCKAVACQYQAFLDAQIAPFIDFLIDDIPTIIGTGRCSVNMLEQLRISAISGKLETGKRYQMRSQDAFYAATTGGGRALKMNIGELEEGYKGDVNLIDWGNPSFHPLVMPVNELVYNTRSSDISEVIVGGKVIKQNGKVLGINSRDTVERAEKAMEKVWTHARNTGVL